MRAQSRAPGSLAPSDVLIPVAAFVIVAGVGVLIRLMFR